MANPPCGGMPCLNASRYDSYGARSWPGRLEHRDVVLVAVQALAAGDELEPAEDQVEAVRVLRPFGVRVRVERPLRPSGSRRRTRSRSRARASPTRRGTARARARGRVRRRRPSRPSRFSMSSCAATKSMCGISAGTLGQREVEQRRARASPRSCIRPTMPASTSRSTAMTVKWSSMKPSSTSSDTYSARWRTVSCGSARNTGPISYTRSNTPTIICL